MRLRRRCSFMHASQKDNKPMASRFRQRHLMRGLRPEPSRHRILTRLRYHRDRTSLDASAEALIREGLRLGREKCHPAGMYCRTAFEIGADASVRLADAPPIRSADLASLLTDCHEVVLLAATVGAEVVECVARDMADGRAARATVLDAVASETADATLDELANLVSSLVRREGARMTRRMSPGYGDLDLSCQRILFDALGAAQLELELNRHHMLVPEKSVLAVAGVKEL